MKYLIKYIIYPPLSTHFLYNYFYKTKVLKKLPIKKVINYCNIWVTKNF